jgi:hypothetical protein
LVQVILKSGFGPLEPNAPQVVVSEQADEVGAAVAWIERENEHDLVLVHGHTP